MNKLFLSLIVVAACTSDPISDQPTAVQEPAQGASIVVLFTCNEDQDVQIDHDGTFNVIPLPKTRMYCYVPEGMIGNYTQCDDGKAWECEKPLEIVPGNCEDDSYLGDFEIDDGVGARLIIDFGTDVYYPNP